MTRPVWRAIVCILLAAFALAACADVTFGDEELSLAEMQATAEAVFEAGLHTEAPASATATLAPPPVLEATPTALAVDSEEQPAGSPTPDPILNALPPTATPEPFLPALEPSATPALPPFWEAYFTAPRRLDGGEDILARLISLIDGAQTSIHIAAFEFNLDEVADALIAAHERGVQVIWITDNEYGLLADSNAGRGQFARLRAAGVPVLADNRSGLMHNKFWVFDGQTVWTGSTNITHNGLYLNNNNVLVLHSLEIAAMYETEFAEMLAGQFGPRSPSQAAEQWAIVEGTAVQVFFGPEDNVMSELTRLVDGAQESVHFMAFSFTYEPLGFVMRLQAESGLNVTGVFETLGSKTIYSEMRPFVCAGLPVRMDGNARLLHHKVIIIDATIVATGSFNFSQNASQANDENLIILASPELARLYLEEFERIWAEGRDPLIGEDVTCE